MRVQRCLYRLLTFQPQRAQGALGKPRLLGGAAGVALHGVYCKFAVELRFALRRARQIELGVGGHAGGRGLARVKHDQRALGCEGGHFGRRCRFGMRRFGPFCVQRQRAGADARRQAARLGALGVEVGLRHVRAVLRGRPGRLDAQRRRSGRRLRRKAGLVRIAPVALQSRQGSGLLARRPERLPLARRVPARHGGGGLGVVEAVDGAGCETKPFQGLFKLAHIVATNAGNEVAIGRDQALKQKHRPS